jgi:hypothetical protein
MTARNERRWNVTDAGSQEYEVDEPDPGGDRGAPTDLESIRAVVVASEGWPAHRYASWLTAVAETQTLSIDHPFHARTGADVVLVSRETLVTHGEATCRAFGRERGSCRLIVATAAGTGVRCADDCVFEPVGRDDLLTAVETARRVAVYDRTVDELLSLTARRRALRERLPSDRPGDRREFVRLSERIDELHSRIDSSLTDVEVRYDELLGRGRHHASDQGGV